MKYICIIMLLFVTASCAESTISAEERNECIKAIDAENISIKVQNFYVDEYGYLCCIISPSDLTQSPDQTAEMEYHFCCKPPMRGVKIFNPDGTLIGKYKAK